jgi:hypothetical protein
MKSSSRIVTLGLLLCLLLTGVTASAKVRSRTVPVAQDISVGGTVIKSGIYLFSFDDKTNELTIADNSKRDVIIARVSARAEAREAAASANDLQLAKQGDSMVLMGLTFAGEKWSISVGKAGQESASK